MDDGLYEWLRRMEEVERSIREFELAQEAQRAMDQIFEHQRVMDRIYEDARRQADRVLEEEAGIRHMMTATLDAQSAYAQEQERMLESMRIEEALQSEFRLSQVIDSFHSGSSVIDAALGVIGGLRPSAVDLMEWQRALEAVHRRMDSLADGVQEPEPIGDEADENLVLQIMTLLWAALGYLARVHFALQVVSGGQLSLIPPSGKSGESVSSYQEVAEVIEAGPIHTVHCRAVMRMEPDSAAEAVHRLDPGDSVRVYEADSGWVQAICSETWHAGWVYKRHIKNP